MIICVHRKFLESHILHIFLGTIEEYFCNCYNNFLQHFLKNYVIDFSWKSCRFSISLRCLPDYNELLKILAGYYKEFKIKESVIKSLKVIQEFRLRQERINIFHTFKFTSLTVIVRRLHLYNFVCLVYKKIKSKPTTFWFQSIIHLDEDLPLKTNVMRCHSFQW